MSIFAITGASQGIGCAAARVADAQGFTVHGCARRPERCLQGYGYAMARVDLSDPAQAARWVRSVPVQAGQREYWLINHGILGPRAPLAQTPVADFAAVLQTNAIGSYAVLQAILTHRSGPRVIAMMSSSVGRHGRAQWGAYAASKAVVESLVQTLADETRPDQLIAFAFNPGGTATAMRAAAYPQEDPATLPAADAVARTLVELMRGAGPGLHGQSLNYRDLA